MTQEQDRPMTTEDLARAGERESARESGPSRRDDSADRQEERGRERNQEAGHTGDQHSLDEPTPTAEGAQLGAEEARTRQGEGAPAEPGSSPREEPIVDDQHRGASGEAQGLASGSQTGSSAGSVHQGGTEVAEAEPSLIEAQEANEYRSRWNDIQGGFVDEPRDTLAKADQLVAEVIQQLTRTFADERSRFEEQWTRGAEVSTEDLRLAFRRYRSFFNGLLP
jgi:hypothetical protein